MEAWKQRLLDQCRRTPVIDEIAVNGDAEFVALGGPESTTRRRVAPALFGVHIEQSESVPKGVIELRNGAKVLARIEGVV